MALKRINKVMDVPFVLSTFGYSCLLYIYVISCDIFLYLSWLLSFVT